MFVRAKCVRNFQRFSFDLNEKDCYQVVSVYKFLPASVSSKTEWREESNRDPDA